MALKSLEDFDKEIASKRARLEKDHALAHALPTVGKTITWMGENGWEPDGRTRKPDVERTIELVPWLIHAPFRGCEHVAFRAPDSLGGDKGEHVCSPHRAAFARKYLRAVLDAFEPHLIDTVAVRGGIYASLVPESFAWGEHKDYKDGHEMSRGLFEVQVTRAVGQYRYSSAALSFYTRTETTGPVRITFNLDTGGQLTTYKLMPRPKYSSRNPSENARPIGWETPNYADTDAVFVFRRRGGDEYSYTCEWLYDSREALETALGLTEQPA